MFVAMIKILPAIDFKGYNLAQKGWIQEVESIN